MKSKALANPEVAPTLSPDDVMKLERHEQVMLDMQSSFNSDMWIEYVFICNFLSFIIFAFFNFCLLFLFVIFAFFNFYDEQFSLIFREHIQAFVF